MTATLTKITEEGLYQIPAAQYFADLVPGGSLSSSGARMLMPPNCPAKFHYERSHPRPDTAAFDEGHIAHTRALGVGDPIRVIEAADWKTNAARAERDEARAAGEVPILAHKYEQILGMEVALRAHELAGLLFTPGAGRAEHSAFWQDDEFGIWRRAMIDWIPDAEPDERQLIIDFKTTTTAEPGAIAKHIHNFRYHQQAAWYVDAVAAVAAQNDIEPAFVFIFQEKDPPYLVTPVQIDNDALEWGRIQNRKAMAIYAECKAANHWPSYTEGIVSVGLPSYAKYQYQDAYDRDAYKTGADDE